FGFTVEVKEQARRQVVRFRTRPGARRGIVLRREDDRAARIVNREFPRAELTAASQSEAVSARQEKKITPLRERAGSPQAGGGRGQARGAEFSATGGPRVSVFVDHAAEPARGVEGGFRVRVAQAFHGTGGPAVGHRHGPV